MLGCLCRHQGCRRPGIVLPEQGVIAGNQGAQLGILTGRDCPRPTWPSAAIAAIGMNTVAKQDVATAATDEGIAADSHRHEDRAQAIRQIAEVGDERKPSVVLSIAFNLGCGRIGLLLVSLRPMPMALIWMLLTAVAESGKMR